MEILFDEDDLEPAQHLTAPEKPAGGKAPKLSKMPAAQAQPFPQTGSLFGDLEDEMGLEPVFAPAPIQNLAAERTAKLFGDEPAADPVWSSKPAEDAAEAKPRVFAPMAPAEAVVETAAKRPQVKRRARNAQQNVDLAEVPVKSAAPKKRRTAGTPEGPQIIRGPQDVAGFTKIREDGSVLEVDPSTCTDPEMFAEMRAERFGRKKPKPKIGRASCRERV